jgi:Cdc6-like AAA superfamily ATPase
VDQLNNRFDDQDRKNILDWLTASDYHAHQQSDFFGRRQQGTGQWLLDSPEFKEWMATSGQTLFCPGMPGAGKTMIVSIVVDHLNNLQQEAGPYNVGIAYLYCNFRQQKEQKLDNLLLSLLKQLVQELGLIPGSVRSLYNLHNRKGTRPKFEEVSKVLQLTVPLYSHVFIIVDAMDECDDIEGDRRRLIHQIFELQKKTGANFFATSRLVGDVEREFIGCRNLEIQASDDDIQEYLDGHMVQLPFFIQRNLGLQDEIRRRIKNAVKGM